MEKQNIKDRNVNFIRVNLITESDCDLKEGEYSLFIAGIIGELDISSVGGTDDISLIKEAIENSLDFDLLPNEGLTEIILKETNELGDMTWNKHYVIERITRVDF
jgi:hypothetical protein